MEIRIKTGTAHKESCEALVLGIFEDELEMSKEFIPLDKTLGGMIDGILKNGDFKGKLNSTYVISTPAKVPVRRVLLVGLGKRKEYTLERLRQAAGKSAGYLSGLGVKTFTTTLNQTYAKVFDSCQGVVEGSILALYTFDKFKTKDRENGGKIKEIKLLIRSRKDEEQAGTGVLRGKVLAEATNFARDLVSEPSNYMTPSVMAEAALIMSMNFGLKCTILERDDMQNLGMGSLLGVARGSAEPPKFIVLEYNGNKKARPLVLVGKAITFDTGGISIKPAENMDKMKSDMAGGAAVMGTLMAAAGLKLPVNLVGLIPATENMPGGKAYKPGDILTAMNGKTIEITNTDAEGRLILADALAYAKEYDPMGVIDIATLTGACVVALGRHASGMMGTSEEMKKGLKVAGEKVFERVWELPLWEEYDEGLKSDAADMKNSGGREAGSIAGGMFLKNFIDYPWVHLDIAGTAWDSKEGVYRPKGATGVGVRLLTEFLTEWKG